MLSVELEETLRRALGLASDHAHEFATLEHLLLAMVEDPDALEVLKGCNVDITSLREMLEAHLQDEMDAIISKQEELEKES